MTQVTSYVQLKYSHKLSRGCHVEFVVPVDAPSLYITVVSDVSAVSISAAVSVASLDTASSPVSSETICPSVDAAVLAPAAAAVAVSLHWKKWKTRHTSFSATKCLDDLFLVFRRRSRVSVSRREIRCLDSPVMVLRGHVIVLWTSGCFDGLEWVFRWHSGVSRS